MSSTINAAWSQSLHSSKSNSFDLKYSELELTMILRFDCKYSILRKFKSFLTISHTDDPLWTRYWGVMKNDKLNLWLYPSDEDVKEQV